MAETETLGDRLRAAREAVGLSQEDLAREVTVRFGVKTTNAAISRIERGATEDPGSQLLVAIAKRLGVSATWLMTGEEIEREEPPDPPHWGEFLRRYEHVGELSEKQLEDVKRFAARNLRVRSWTDFERVAEIVRTSRPSPTFEAKKAARLREKNRAK